MVEITTSRCYAIYIFNLLCVGETFDYTLIEKQYFIHVFDLLRWVIKARVMSKSDIRTWNNARGEGKLFSMDLCDDSGEIRATAFKNECDKFYDMIQVRQIICLNYYLLALVARLTLSSAHVFHCGRELSYSLEVFLTSVLKNI